jgi:hypothetical protein
VKFTPLVTTWSQFTAAVATLPEKTLWRHNQASDLPGQGDAIDRPKLDALVKANTRRRGFTYSHKPITGKHGAADACMQVPYRVARHPPTRGKTAA